MNWMRYLFHRHVLRSFSQEMQDRWCIDDVHHGKRGGYFVEFGAYDGVRFSNTLLLERAYDWSGICVEPHPSAFRLLAANRRCTVVHCAVGSSRGSLEITDSAMLSTGMLEGAAPARTITVQVRSLGDILEEHGAPSTIDFMSVDVEGFEDEALLTFPFDRWRVLAMCVERPSVTLFNRLLAWGYRSQGTIEGLDSFFVHPDVSGARPYARRAWSRFQYRLEAAIHRLEHWGVLEDGASDWGQ